MQPIRRNQPILRREFVGMAGSLLASCAMGAGCRTLDDGPQASEATLTARPSATTTTSEAGTRALGLARGRDAVLHVPAGAGNGPLPLIVLLHGAGGSGERFFRRLGPAIDSFPVAILAPDSRGPTWDAIRVEQQTVFDVLTSERQLAGFGPDVMFLNQALERVFQTVAVDPARVAVGGFSDGATYALSLGLMHGDLFRRIVAFSPGFVVEGAPRGRPQIFVSHGRADQILPIDRCSRRIVPDLRRRGYAITFREFDGGHSVPDTVARDAIKWAISTDV